MGGNMTPEMVLTIGIGILIGTAGLGIVAAVVLKWEKKRIQHQLKAEYGERRR